ncbi:MAG: hypothetical protein ACXABY_29745, partial [Candidatus Thorarchaeota archaeon]
EFDENGNNWPEGEMTIFRGYFNGFAYRKVQNKVQAVVHLVHWLSDLEFSSMVSRAMHPSTPAELIYKANTQVLGSGTTAKGPQNFAERVGVAGQDLLTTDLWSAIKTVLCGVAGAKFPEVKAPDGSCGGVKQESNSEAKAALVLMEDQAAADCQFQQDTEGNGDKLGVPLTFEPEFPVTFAKRVAETLGAEGLKNYVQNSFWGVLVNQFSTKFRFAIAPLPGRALVVPFQAGSRPTWEKTLRPQEYAFIDFNAHFERPMQSMNIYGGYQGRTFAKPYGKQGDIKQKGMFGCYKPEDSEFANRGAARFVQAPMWLLNPLSGQYAGGTTGVKDVMPQASGTQPDIKTTPPEDPAPNDLRLKYTDMWNSYAQSLYVQGSLAGRQGAVTGKLRFDIAPGSTVLLEQQPERFIGAEDELAAPLVGHVMRVTFNINSESRNASTSFKLAFMRTEAENEKDRLSVDKNPLYSQPWVGAPLIPEYKF